LDVAHEPIFISEKRKALDPQSTPCIFVGYPDDVKGYRLIDPSTDRLIIEHSVQFEEIPSHAPPEQHADTLVLPSVADIRDDDSIHSDATYSNSYSKDFVHGVEQVVQSDDEPTLELQQLPKWAKSTLQATGDLARNQLDSRRTRSQHAEPSHVLSASEPTIPMHCYMVQSSDLHLYSEVVGNPLWQAAMQKEYDSLLQNQT
jgi:hypothetical protein